MHSPSLKVLPLLKTRGNGVIGEATGRRTPLCFAQAQAATEAALACFFIGHIHHHIPKAYLFRIAKNLALDELDRRSRKMTDFIEECEAASMVELSENMDEQIQAEQSVLLHCKAATMLPKRCREVYLLRKVHGLSHKEIAARLDISLSAVGKHLTKGMLRRQPCGRGC